MNEKENFELTGRKAQESLSQMITAGYYKELIKVQKAFFDCYIENGFTREEALKLTMNIIPVKND